MLTGQAKNLLRDALVWDAHAGFGPTVEVDLNELSHWTNANVDFLSINVGFDVIPWEETIRNLAAFRHWLEQRPDRFVLVEHTGDILRAKSEGKLAIAFDLEGACPLGGQLSMLSLYHRLGVRQMHFVYNLNNEAAGGCHDNDQGLTEFGRSLLKEANRLGILVDLSHSGYRTSMEIMEKSIAPVVYSHANPKALSDHPRNITDEQMRACAATGGLVAVTGIGQFLGDIEASSASFVRAIDMTVERIGVQHVGIGLDYDFDLQSDDFIAKSPRFWPSEFYSGKFANLRPDQLPEVTELLLRKGYTETDIRAILGGNYLRVAEKVWTSMQPI
ncbi:membrane dipeptidase [Paenibacillus sp. LMG 31460]|uniref:Membrane dipeptidase n=2 Tax=Paenibacillus germinis TaxID=2654979 RepID=A0ABX1Z7S0_9BACL|nr:membrane dipeptidase [Paenibacillus germinis]